MVIEYKVKNCAKNVVAAQYVNTNTIEDVVNVVRRQFSDTELYRIDYTSSLPLKPTIDDRPGLIIDIYMKFDNKWTYMRRFRINYGEMVVSIDGGTYIMSGDLFGVLYQES